MPLHPAAAQHAEYRDACLAHDGAVPDALLAHLAAEAPAPAASPAAAAQRAAWAAAEAVAAAEQSRLAREGLRRQRTAVLIAAAAGKGVAAYTPPAPGGADDVANPIRVAVTPRRVRLAAAALPELAATLGLAGAAA